MSHQVLLPLLLVLVAVVTSGNSVSLAEICGHKCNFTSLYQGLSLTLGTATNTANDKNDNEADRAAADFASGLSALNLRLRQQLGNAADCTKRWLNRPVGTNCYDLCCPGPTLGDLIPAMDCLKAEVKLSIAGAADAASAALPQHYNYQDVAFDTYNVFSGAFMDFVRQLAIDPGQARIELNTFGVFYTRLQMLPKQLTITLIPRNHSDCVKLRPLWRNMFGVALQQLVMREIVTSSTASGDSEAVWQTYLSVAEIATRTTIACNAISASKKPRSGGVAGDDDTVGPRSSKITLAVLLPILLLLLAILIGIIFKSWRRRRRRGRCDLAMKSSMAENVDALAEAAADAIIHVGSKITEDENNLEGYVVTTVDGNGIEDVENEADCDDENASRSSADGADLVAANVGTVLHRPDGTVIVDPDEV